MDLLGNTNENLYMTYMGGKQAIAHDILSVIPPAKTFIDCCTGGGGIFYKVLYNYTNKWQNVIGNDLCKDLVYLHNNIELVEEANFKFCGRDDFYNSLKNIEQDNFDINDCINKYCNSFGCGGGAYAYSIKTYKFKKILFDILFGYIPEEEVDKNIEIYMEEFKKYYKDIDFANVFNIIKSSYNKKLEGRSFLNKLEKLNGSTPIVGFRNLPLFNNLLKIKKAKLKYKKEYKILNYNFFDLIDKMDLKDCVIYLDPPYENTAEYTTENIIDYDYFWQWFKNLPCPAFASSYQARDGVECIFSIKKKQLLGGTNGKIVNENLYFNGFK